VTGQIFISHSSQDYEQIVEPLVDMLVTGAGLSNQQVFCSNAPGLGIPAGASFMAYIQRNLQQSALTVHLITPAFLRSQFCLLELGAAWERGNCFPLVVPPLSIGQLLNGPLAGMQLKSLDRQGLDSLYDSIASALTLSRRVSTWSVKRDRFLNGLHPDPPGRQAFLHLTTAAVRGHHIEAWKVTEDGSVFHRWWPSDPDESDWTWVDWQKFPAPANISGIAAGSRGDGEVEVFVVDISNRLWYRHWRIGSGWSGWYPLKDNVIGPISVASYKEGHLEVFAQSPSGSRLLHAWGGASGQWSYWDELS
jgi:hypothetical protein